MNPGYFGEMGGRYVPETLMGPLLALEKAWEEVKKDAAFWAEWESLLRNYVGRPTPLYRASRIEKEAGTGVRVFLKREDLCHTGAHKINNAIGQVLLARRMGKTRIIAETGAGQHGVATATACALLGLQCEVFMGAEDVARQSPNVQRMKHLGAVVRPVEVGSKTLKDAMNEALRNWVATVRDTHYVIGSVAGPHPYPTMVRDFQAVIGREVRAQLNESKEAKGTISLLACIGGGSNAMGLFADFIDDPAFHLIGVEAAGDGLTTHRHAASLEKGEPGILHGSRSLYLQDSAGQIAEAHSIAAGLDYPGVGPQLAHLYQSKRLSVVAVTDTEALEAFGWLARTEGIIPALETAHAISHLRKLLPRSTAKDVLVVNVSGRGDKDLAHVAAHLGKPAAQGQS